MKKIFTRIIIFLIIFVIIFYNVQKVLHYRWSDSEDMFTRNVLYIEEPKDSIDILFFGTSEIYAGIFPTAIYHEAGITSINFATSYKSAITTYYQLQFALKSQSPQIVVCDFAALFEDCLPSEEEAIYRKIVDTMPDRQIKEQLINDICALDSTQSKLSYYFPMLRYHGMWNQLETENFERDYVCDREYPVYKKGCFLLDRDFDENDYFMVEPRLWETSASNESLSQLSVEYYDAFIEECHSRDIEVIALIPPKLLAAKEKTARWDIMKSYFDSRNVMILDYNTYEEVTRLGLTLEDDYYDGAHLNASGAVVFSEDFAKKVQNIFDLKDHRGEKDYKVWDQYWNNFTLDYNYLKTSS